MKYNMCKIHINKKSEATVKTIEQKVTQDINQHRNQKIDQVVVFKEQNEDVNNLTVIKKFFSKSINI